MGKSFKGGCHLLFLLLFLLGSVSGKGIAVTTAPKGLITEGEGNYMNYEDLSWTIDSTSTSKVVFLTVTSLHTECGWDYLHIYDGLNSSSPKIGGFCGNRVRWSTDVIMSSSRYLHLNFVSDAAVTSSGFQLIYSTGPCPQNCIKVQGGVSSCSAKNCQCFLNDNSQIQCTKISATDPPVRTGHTLTYLEAEDSYLLFGGVDQSEKPMNDLYSFTFDGTGAKVAPRLNATTIPGLSRHAAAASPNKLYIYGGKTSQGTSNALYSYSFQLGWQKLAPEGPSPPALFGHSMTYVPEMRAIYLFGGFSPSTGTSNRLFAYMIDENRWVKIQKSTPEPPNLHSHIAFLHPSTKRILFHGGLRDDGLGEYSSGALLSFNYMTRKWESISSQNAMVSHAVVQISPHQYAIQGGFLPHTSGETIRETDPCHLSSLYIFDALCNKWVLAFNGTSEWARYGHTLFYQNKTLHLYGGFNGRLFSGFSTLPLQPPSVDYDNCTVSYCQRAADCSKCLANTLCSWCSEQSTCTASSTALANASAFPTCQGPTSTCQQEPQDCFSRTSCQDCLMEDSEACSWCGEYSACLPANLTTAFNCSTSWDLKICPRDFCDIQNSCSSCTSSEIGGQKCAWCDTKNSCGLLGESSCSVGSPADCQIPCLAFGTSVSCIQQRSCSWCASTSQCIDSGSFLGNFPFGECLTWSTYEILPLAEKVESSLKEKTYMDFLIEVEGKSDVELVISAKASNLLSIDFQGFSSTYSNSTSLTITPANGRHMFRITNRSSQNINFELIAVLQVHQGGGGGGGSFVSNSFNIIYFVSFFFLFLFSFLFLAAIGKKIRDLILFNRRALVPPEFGLRQIPKKFCVNILENNGELILLRPGSTPQPIAVEYIERKSNDILCAVTVICIMPFSSTPSSVPPSAPSPSTQPPSLSSFSSASPLVLSSSLSSSSSCSLSPAMGAPQRVDYFSSLCFGTTLAPFVEDPSKCPLATTPNEIPTIQETARIRRLLSEQLHQLNVRTAPTEGQATNFPDELIDRLDAEYLRRES